MEKEQAEKYNEGAVGDILGGGLRQEGFEGARAGDFKQSYLTHLQTGSPQVKKEKPEYVAGAEAGLWYDTLTKRVLPKAITVNVVKRETVWLEFDENSNLTGVHVPDSIPVDKTDYKKWRYRGHDITESINHYVFLQGYENEGLKILPLKGSDIKHAKSWFTDMKNLQTPSGGNAHLFAAWWTLELQFNTAKTDDGKEVDWYTIGKGKTSSAKFDRFINPDEFKSFVEGGRELVKSLSQASTQKALPGPSETPSDY